MKQIQDAFNNYPWMILLLAGVLLLGISATVLVIFIMKKQEQKRIHPFEALDRQEPVSVEPVSQHSAASPVYDDGDMTRRLFDYPDMDLKSYQLNLYDLNMPGKVYRVTVSDRITIGRKSSCMVCIPNSTLSGEDCEIILRNGKLVLRDLNSTNGTFLNGNTNRVTEEELETGSIIEMGSVKLKAEISILKM